jgi:PHD/YefM family antitoxin component YafN of YafNO toxin-antitoxin module
MVLLEVRVMPNKPVMETHSVQELQNDAPAIVKRVGELKKPVRIKRRGSPPVVVVDEDTYDWYIHLINLGRLLNEGMEDVRLGRTRPLEEFLDAHEKKVRAENLHALLEEGEAEIRAGKSRPMEEFLEEFSRAHKIPRRTRPTSRTRQS